MRMTNRSRGNQISLQMFVSHHVMTRSWTQDLWRCKPLSLLTTLNHWDISPTVVKFDGSSVKHPTPYPQTAKTHSESSQNHHIFLSPYPGPQLRQKPLPTYHRPHLHLEFQESVIFPHNPHTCSRPPALLQNLPTFPHKDPSLSKNPAHNFSRSPLLYQRSYWHP